MSNSILLHGIVQHFAVQNNLNVESDPAGGTWVESDRTKYQLHVKVWDAGYAISVYDWDANFVENDRGDTITNRAVCSALERWLA